MKIDDMAPTPPLAEFLAVYGQDDNWWWRVSCGHHQNLFDDAVDRIEAAQAISPEDHATKSRDYGRGFADAILLVRQALRDG